MCSKFTSEQSVSGGGHLSHPMTLTRLSQHGPVFDGNPDRGEATFFASWPRLSIIRRLAAILEEASKPEPTTKSTEQPISSGFSFASDIRAKAETVAFSYQYTLKLGFPSVPAPIDI